MASNTPKRNRSDQSAAEQRLVNGLVMFAQKVPLFVIGGVTMTTNDVIRELQMLIDSANAVQSTRAHWQNTVQSDKEARATHSAFVSGLKQTLLVAFAGSIDSLAHFGLYERKRPILTPEQRKAAAAKAKATRAARHTMGPKQKAAIKGTVAPTKTTTPANPSPQIPVT